MEGGELKKVELWVCEGGEPDGASAGRGGERGNGVGSLCEGNRVV